MIKDKNKSNKTCNMNNKIINAMNTDSSYIMLSTTIYRKNLYEAVNNDSLIISRINEWLNTLNNNAVSLTLNEATENLLLRYAEKFFIRPDGVIEDCLDLLKNPSLLSKVIKLENTVRSGVNNLVFTLDCKNLISLYNKPDDILDYAHVLWNFVVLAVISSFYKDIINLNLELFYNFVTLNIATGMRIYAEFEIDGLYRALYQEIEPILSDNKMAIKIRKNNPKQTMVFTVKNNYILDKAFKEEGYFKTKRKYHEFLDSRSKGELRIMQGKTTKHVRLVAYISGMRTISRLLSLNCNPNQKIYLRSIGSNNTGLATDRILSFYFRTILSNCKGRIVKSEYGTYYKFIKRYKKRTGKKNSVARNTLIAILLSKQPKEKQKELINTDLKKTDKTPRIVVNNDLKAINNLLKRDKKSKSTLERFILDLRRFYGW